jgi:hypothetical protein
MTNTEILTNPEFADPTFHHPELDANELATAIALRAELSSIVNQQAAPAESRKGRTLDRPGQSRRRWRIFVPVLTALGTAAGAVALNPTGSTALAAQYTGAAVPAREPHYAPTSLPEGYVVSNLVRPETFKTPVAQTLLLGREDNGQIRDYTAIDLLGSWAPTELTKPPEGNSVRLIDGHKSWEVETGDPNWSFHQVALDCGTANMMIQVSQRDAVVQRLSALFCSDTKLKIKAVDQLSLLYDGPPHANQTGAFLFTIATPSHNSAIASVGWSVGLPDELAKRLSSFVPERPRNDGVAVNEAIGYLWFDTSSDLFRVQFAAPPETGGAVANIQVAGKSKEEVLTIARSIQAVSDLRWNTIADRAGINR